MNLQIPTSTRSLTSESVTSRRTLRRRLSRNSCPDSSEEENNNSSGELISSPPVISTEEESEKISGSGNTAKDLFSDVSRFHMYYDAIGYAKEKNIVSGY